MAPRAPKQKKFPLRAQEEGIVDLALSRDGARLATVSKKRVRIHALGSMHGKADEVAPRNGFTAAAWAPDGTLALADGHEIQLRLPNGDLGRRWFASPTFAIAFSPDGRLLAVGAEVGAVYDSANGRLVRKLDHGTKNVILHEDVMGGDDTADVARMVCGVAFSSDGRKLASVGESRQGRIWDAVTGTLIASFGDCGRYDNYGQQAGTNPYDVYHAVAFLPDGASVAVARDEGIGLIHAATGAVLRELSQEAATRLAFSTEGGRLAAATGHGALILAASSGEVLERFTEGAVSALAFLPAGGSLVTASPENGVVSVWTLAASSAIAT
jgi:WD40 repeat protein